MLTRIFMSILLFIAVPASAQDDLSGRWALRASDATMMVFEIQQTEVGWAAAWERPAHFQSDGFSFTRVEGPIVREIARSIRETENGIEIAFGEEEVDEFLNSFKFRKMEGDKVEVSHPAFGNDPAVLIRENAADAFGPWDVSRVYVRFIERPTNPEMTAIFEADQAARRDWATNGRGTIPEEDAERRAQTQRLLDNGELRSGDDFYHAAFVFQHGDQPSDFLKAHSLAVIAAARGKVSATWIAAATFDRYLQSIGQPQIYGTQFSESGGIWTQAPYDSDVLSDGLRTASLVPSLTEQQLQLQQFVEQEASAND